MEGSALLAGIPGTQGPGRDGVAWQAARRAMLPLQPGQK